MTTINISDGSNASYYTLITMFIILLITNPGLALMLIFTLITFHRMGA